MIKELCNGINSRPIAQTRTLIGAYFTDRKGKLKAKSNIRVVAETCRPAIEETLLLCWVLLSHALLYLFACTGFFFLVWLFCPACKSYETNDYAWRTQYLWFPHYYYRKWNWLKYAKKRRAAGDTHWVYEDV